jgi:hypothetical protein
MSRTFLLKLPYLSYLHHQKFIVVHSDASFLLPTSLFSCFPYLFIHKLSLLLAMKAPSFTPSSVSSFLSKNGFGLPYRWRWKIFSCQQLIITIVAD